MNSIRNSYKSVVILRTLLQMSVWQDFLIAMAYINPDDEEEVEINNLVFHLFKILLIHAVQYEYGGWRVWIDTLSIVHSRVNAFIKTILYYNFLRIKYLMKFVKVSREEYQIKMKRLYDEYEKNRSNLDENDRSSS